MATKPKAGRPKRRKPRKSDLVRIGELERRIKELEGRPMPPFRPGRELLPPYRPARWVPVPPEPWLCPDPYRDRRMPPYRPPIFWL